ncbi:MAG: alpha/beta hydrolase [Solirubrobacteraceae bacterium]
MTGPEGDTLNGAAVTEHTESSLLGAGAVNIFWQAWRPAGRPRAVVVIAHGVSEHSGRYGHVAERFVREGYAVYALDHRGHGRSGGPRPLIDRMGNAVDDLDSLVVLAVAAHPGAGVYLLGHSMGGAISVRYAMAHQDRLAGLILSGPLAALDAASPPVRIIAKVLSALTPRLGVVSLDARLVSRDPAVVRDYETDPLNSHGKLPARTVAELAGAIESFPAGVGIITVPTLIMYGTADQLCPTEGSVMLHERIGATDKTIRAFDGLYHEILNEPEQELVLDDLCAWLDARAPAGE